MYNQAVAAEKQQRQGRCLVRIPLIHSQADEDLPLNLQSVCENSQAADCPGSATAVPFLVPKCLSHICLLPQTHENHFSSPNCAQPRGKFPSRPGWDSELPVHALCSVFDLPDLQMLYSTNGKTKAVVLLVDFISFLTHSSESQFSPVFPTLLCLTLNFLQTQSYSQ